MKIYTKNEMFDQLCDYFINDLQNLQIYVRHGHNEKMLTHIRLEKDDYHYSIYMNEKFVNGVYDERLSPYQKYKFALEMIDSVLSYID